MCRRENKQNTSRREGRADRCIYMAQQWFEKFTGDDIEPEEQRNPRIPEDYYIINSEWNIYKKLIRKYSPLRRARVRAILSKELLVRAGSAFARCALTNYYTTASLCTTTRRKLHLVFCVRHCRFVHRTTELLLRAQFRNARGWDDPSIRTGLVSARRNCREDCVFVNARLLRAHVPLSRELN